MSDLLGIGISGLLAYRRALDVTGHNIANVETEGYSRQRADLAARRPSGSGNGFIGNGVDPRQTRRVTDAFLTARSQTDASALSRLDTLHQVGAQVDGWFSDPATGLGASLSGLRSALSDLASDPASRATRETVLSSAEATSARFRQLSSRLDTLETELNGRTAQTVEEINQFSRQIADLNQRIVLEQGRAGGQPANDLLDQRDQLLKSLAERVSIQTRAAADGSVDVSVGQGQALVLGAQAQSLGLAASEYSGQPARLLLGGAEVTRLLAGGTLGGLQDARREVLLPARQDLAGLARQLGEAVNRAQAAGTTPAGGAGGDLFSLAADRVQGARSNTGSASLSVSASASARGEYELRFDGASWSLTDLATGLRTPFSGSGTPADPWTAAGLSLQIDSGSAAAGDRFLLQPHRQAAGSLTLATRDPQQLATAAPLSLSAAAGNSGSGRLASVAIVDPSAADLRSPGSLEIIAADRYRLDGVDYPLPADGRLQAHGLQLQFQGTPVVGDRWTLTPTAAGSRDGLNAQALVQAFDQAGLVDRQAGLVAAAGSRSAGFASAQSAQAALSAQTSAEIANVSGVSLDEEAANLLRFEQAYQAAAQVIAVADTVFQSLLEATRS
ncbi:MAG TPA: flagellar hook-associated protein FlgK [Nevskiaceae bacterium]|nr:flagellar hook-associated protein FlgK [Nevskiaceae bacterium]